MGNGLSSSRNSGAPRRRKARYRKRERHIEASSELRDTLSHQQPPPSPPPPPRPRRPHPPSHDNSPPYQRARQRYDARRYPPYAAAPDATKVKYGRPEKLGLVRKEFVNVHRKEYTGRIELLQGSVEGLSKSDETDLLIVYLRGRGQYKANRDSSLAALNRSGIKLADLERESTPEPSYRRHYHCWLSRQLSKKKPVGFEYKRLLVYEDPGEELTTDDNIVLDIVKCLTTVIGGDVQINSVLIPLSGALLSPSLRKHFVKAAVEVSYAWMRMGLPLKTVKILLPETDITKDVETFRKAKEKLLTAAAHPVAPPPPALDIYFSYAEADKDAAKELISHLKLCYPTIQIYEAESRNITIKERGVVDNNIMDNVAASRVFLALLSDAYFSSVECTEAFSLAYCKDFESQGNFIIPLFWRTCDLTPLARRLVVTEGIDCREANFQTAFKLMDEIATALTASSPRGRHMDNPDDLFEGCRCRIGPSYPGNSADEENSGQNRAV